MEDVARQAIRGYVENHSRAELLDRVLDGDDVAAILQSAMQPRV
jgi:hypothetical protein